MANLQNPLIFWLRKAEDIKTKTRTIQNTKRGVQGKIDKALHESIIRIEDEALLELYCLSLVSQKAECMRPCR